MGAFPSSPHPNGQSNCCDHKRESQAEARNEVVEPESLASLVWREEGTVENGPYNRDDGGEEGPKNQAHTDPQEDGGETGPTNEAHTDTQATVETVAVGATAPEQQHMERPGAPTSYQKIRGTRFAELLESGAFQVVKGQYFVDQYTQKEPIQMRQDIPDEYTWPGSEALQRWIRYGPRFLVAISYAWLAKEHPDPDRFQLQRLARITQAHRDFYAKQPTWNVVYEGEGRDDVLEGDIGIILDYCCFYQKKVVNGVDTRTDAQKAQLKAGLEEINTIYGHEAIMAWRLEQVPEHVPRKYSDRGWTLFERVIIDGKGKWGYAVNTNLVFAGETDAGTCTDEELADTVSSSGSGSNLLRGPPWTPARFAVELQKRNEGAQNKGVLLFTNGKEDLDLVLRKYGESYEQLRRAAALHFSAQRWTAADFEALLEALGDFRELQVLDFAWIRPCVGSNRLARRVAALMRAGQLPKLRSISFLFSCLDPCSQAQLLHAWLLQVRCCFPVDLCLCGLCCGPSCLGLGCCCMSLDGDGDIVGLALPWQCCSLWSLRHAPRDSENAS